MSDDKPVKPGPIIEVKVYHDEWCNLLLNKGPCNCNPVCEAEKVKP